MSNAKELQKVLEDVLGGKSNLPSNYQDFEELTRDLIRKLADKLVLVDRRTWNEISRPKTPNSLEACTAHYKAFNDKVESSMKRRGSIPPPFEDNPPNARPKM